MTKRKADFTADNLAGILLSPQDTCLLVIDVEKEFFGRETADKTARKINSFAQALRKRGIPLYDVFYDDTLQEAKEEIWRFQPQPQDTIVLKDGISAFSNGKVYEAGNPIGKLADVFTARGIRNVIVCGGYLTACVKETVKDGIKLRKNFNFYVVSNLTTNGKTGYNSSEEDLDRAEYQRMRAKIAPAADIFKTIRH